MLILLVTLSMPVRGEAATAFNLFEAVVIFPSIILAGSAAPVDASRRYLTFLGNASYPLYAIHLPIVLTAVSFATLIDDYRLRAAALTLMLVLLIVSAWALDRWVDARAGRFLRRLLQLRTRRV